MFTQESKTQLQNIAYLIKIILQKNQTRIPKYRTLNTKHHYHYTKSKTYSQIYKTYNKTLSQKINLIFPNITH